MNETDSNTPSAADLIWRSSTYSPNTNCVEFAEVPGGKLIAMRNSNDPDGPILWLARGQVGGLIQGAKAGEFDYLV